MYTLDRGITLQILEAGMGALGEFHAKGKITSNMRRLINDQHQALEMIMDLIGARRQLTSSYIKELHHQLTLNQSHCEAVDQFGKLIQIPLLKGAWKRQENNPRRPDGKIPKYCPPDFVQDEIDQLLNWHRSHEDICPEVEAAWLHHRFVQIHPFQDGNGRVARALTSAVFLKSGYLTLVIRDEEHREKYLDALEEADNGHLKPLVDLFADIQIDDLSEGIKSIRELRGESIANVSKELAERAKRRWQTSIDQSILVIDHFIEVTEIRFDEVKAELERAFAQQNVGVKIWRSASVSDNSGWWTREIIEVANQFNYFVDLKLPRRWVTLNLSLPDLENEPSKIVVSIHAVGRIAGLYSVTAFLTTVVDAGENSTPLDREMFTVSEKPFRFSTKSQKKEAVEREFRTWLEKTIENSLNVWGEKI